jgi:hypothetical protein
MPFESPAGLAPKIDDPRLRVGIPYRKRTQENPMIGGYSQDFGPFDGKVWLNCAPPLPRMEAAARAAKDTDPRLKIFQSSEPRHDRPANREVRIEPGSVQYLKCLFTKNPAQPQSRLPPDAWFEVL